MYFCVSGKEDDNWNSMLWLSEPNCHHFYKTYIFLNFPARLPQPSRHNVWNISILGNFGLVSIYVYVFFFLCWKTKPLMYFKMRKYPSACIPVHASMMHCPTIPASNWLETFCRTKHPLVFQPSCGSWWSVLIYLRVFQASPDLLLHQLTSISFGYSLAICY